MKPSTLQYLWSLVEQTPTRQLLEWDDRRLIEVLLGQLKQQRILDQTELTAAEVYLNTRLGLIRDVADARPHTDRTYHCAALRTWTPQILVESAI